MASAAKTTVAPEKSRAEMDQTLRRYGADASAAAARATDQSWAFRAHDRRLPSSGPRRFRPAPSYTTPWDATVVSAARFRPRREVAARACFGEPASKRAPPGGSTTGPPARPRADPRQPHAPAKPQNRCLAGISLLAVPAWARPSYGGARLIIVRRWFESTRSYLVGMQAFLPPERVPRRPLHPLGVQPGSTILAPSSVDLLLGRDSRLAL
jgi:hypothetical protein